MASRTGPQETEEGLGKNEVSLRFSSQRKTSMNADSNIPKNAKQNAIVAILKKKTAKHRHVSAKLRGTSRWLNFHNSRIE
jgi:hypothetical protein